MEVFSYPWTPVGIYGARYALFPAYTEMLWAEIDDAAPVVTQAKTDNSPVGTIVSPIDGHITTVINGASTACRPFLVSDSTGSGNQRRNSFLRFGASSQLSALYVENSTGAFRSIHTTQQYTVAFWLRMQTGGSVGGDGVAQDIMDSQGGSGGFAGMQIYRGADDKLYFSTNSGSGWLAQLVSSSTVSSSNGWVAVVIQSTGGGGTCTMTFNGSTVATATPAAGAALGTNAAYNLFIGQSVSGSLRGQFDIDNILIADRVISAADLTKWLNFNPPRNTTTGSLLRVKSEASSLDPTDFSHLWAWWDFSTARDPVSDQPLLYTSSGASTAVANTGDLIGYAENRGGAHLLRYVSQSTSGQVPSWEVAQQNGRPAAYLNGSWNSGSSVSAPYSFQLNTVTPFVNKTWYFVAQQTYTGGSGGLGTAGGHMHNYSGAQTVYAAISGVGYEGHPAGWAQHFEGDSVNTAACSCYPYLTVTGTGGAAAAAGTYVYTLDYQGGAQYYCAAANSGAGLYIWYTSNNYVISSTPGVSTGNYWTISTPSPLGSYTAAGGASGTPVVSGSFPGPQGWNVYYGQQSGTSSRVGVNGYWGPWSVTTGTTLFDNFGKDAHQNTATPSATTHWEFNGYIGEGAVFVASLPSHRFYQLMRRLSDKWNIPIFNGN
ncbi:MAG TPA: hypothetical protein VHY91_14440 [Pirellulales bacterium]|jgi:hypothetical protein|nr:hypothetical protein [Pirellulales bacterium]